MCSICCVNNNSCDYKTQRILAAQRILAFDKILLETATTQTGEDLFGQKSSNDKKLLKDKAEAFDTTVAQGLFLTKRGRPDINTGIAFLCTQVQQPDDENWEELIQFMKYLSSTKRFVLTLGADLLNILIAVFAAHPDF